MSVQRVFSGAPWEAKVGYCRALRAGNQVFVTGTVAAEPDGTIHAPGDPYAQALRCFSIIGEALEGVGASLKDIVRTRMFVTDISQWEAIGKAHGEVFKGHPPATTMVEVSALIGPSMLVEIEADAIVGLGG
ncbi:MAG: RidA family protein [Longimicrobiales bacterium]